MHSAVMQNKKYMQFAAQNTVEVLSLGGLDQGIEKDDPRAATYKGKDGIERMVSWPSLTKAQIDAFRASKASSYSGRGIPFTAIVDPHTLEAASKMLGGQSAQQVQEAAEELLASLRKQHGRGLSRKIIQRLDMSIAKAEGQTAKGDFSKALKSIEKGAKGSDKWPEALQERAETARQAVVSAAEEAVEAASALEPKEAKRALMRLKSKVRGTGLADRVKELLAEL